MTLSPSLNVQQEYFFNWRGSPVGSTELVAGTPEKTLTKFTIKPATFHIDTSTGGNGAKNGVKNGGESDKPADKSEPKSSESLCDKVNKESTKFNGVL